MISRRSFPTTFLQKHWFWQIGGGPWADSLTILVEKHMMHFQINGVLFTTPICVFMWSIRPQNSSSRTATTEFLAYNCNPFYMPSPSKPNPVSVCHQLYQSLWEPQVWPSISKPCFRFPWIFQYFSFDNSFKTKYKFPGQLCIRSSILLQNFTFSHLNTFIEQRWCWHYCLSSPSYY